MIIAYRELRALEIDLIREIRALAGEERQGELDATVLSLVDVDQFYGIELGEFPVRIAETAMWMMDHIMNIQLSLAFGQVYVRIPLKTSPHIVHGDALENDWAEILPPEDCSFVFGNPPFVGAKLPVKVNNASRCPSAGQSRRSAKPAWHTGLCLCMVHEGCE